MSARTFIDTNVLVKLWDDSVPAKQQAAVDRLREERRSGGPTVSPIVLGELFHALTRTRSSAGRTLPPILARPEAIEAVRHMARLEVCPITLDTMLATLGILDRHRKLKAWDAVHLATAAGAGCDTLLTWDSDFPDGSTIEGVVIEHLAIGEE